MTFEVGQLPRFSVMGVLNVTPDSFSDGGRFDSVERAVAHGLRMAHDGAAIIDIGGESSRPGAVPVPLEVELARVVPVVQQLAGLIDVPISIDTTKAAVADAALQAGAAIVNDISAGTADAEMLSTVARHDAGVVLMHMQGTPATMQRDPQYVDVVHEVIDHLRGRVEAARASGVRGDAIVVDPGIGFGKTVDHNLTLIANTRAIADALAVPLLLGTSRKGFIGAVLGGAPVESRDDATVATSALAFTWGASIVRVHDVAASVAAARVIDAVMSATQQGVLT